MHLLLLPQGLNNSLIQAVWSPRVCIVQRKTNRYSINDRSYSAYERAVTYEGPSHYTEDGIPYHLCQPSQFHWTHCGLEMGLRAFSAF